MNTRQMVKDLKGIGFTNNTFAMLFRSELSDIKDWLRDDEIPPKKQEILKKVHETKFNT